MSEIDVTQEEVREEHLREAHERAHWLYFSSVILGGFLLMLIIMAALDAGAA